MFDMTKGSVHIAPDCSIPPMWTDQEFWDCVNLLERLSSSQLFDLSAALGIHYDEKSRTTLDLGSSILILLDEGSGGKERIISTVREYASVYVK